MRSWVTENPATGRLIIKSVMALVQSGIPEGAACYRVATQFGQNERVLIKVWNKVKARMQKNRTYKLPPHVRYPAKCVYCGQPGRMVPVMDFRRKAVGAHVVCELLEQMLAGGL